MSDIWYYADGDAGGVGPLTLRELKEALAGFSDAGDMLVWCDGFQDWKLAKDVPELRAKTVLPPPLPRKRAMVLQTNSDGLRISMQRRMVIGSAGIIAVLGMGFLAYSQGPAEPEAVENSDTVSVAQAPIAEREANARQLAAQAAREQQAIDAENAKAKAKADKAAEVKKIAARRAAYKTIAPLEPDAHISDGWEDEEGAINFAVKMVRLNGYRCDSVSALRPFLWGGRGAVLKCNQYDYSYDIADKGGHWVVTVE
jgi:hypothetical protein